MANNMPSVACPEGYAPDFDSLISGIMVASMTGGRGGPDFLGRIDDQVKVRGYRVEPGEIEVALRSHAAVQECVVKAIEEPAPDSDNRKSKVENPKSLIAYVVPRPNTEINSPALQKHLTNQLPEYMVPRRFLFVDALPLTPSGKLDRRALPLPDCTAGAMEQEYVAPRTVLERQLAAIWEEVLGVKQVGIHANFFEFGGHSLNGMKVIARVREQCHVDAPVRWLFESPTIAGLAEKIQLATLDTAKPTGALTCRSASLFELKPGTGKMPVFFLPGGYGGDGEFLVYAKLLQLVGEEFTFYGLRPRSANGETPAPERVEDMAAEYLKEITAVDPNGPYLLVGNCIGGIVAFELARQLSAEGRPVAQCIMMDTVCPTARGSASLIQKAKRKIYELANHYYVERAALHAEQASRLSNGEKLSYFWALAKDLPRVERARRNKATYMRTLASYRPKIYAGPVTMIVSENLYSRDPTLGWSPFISTKVHAYKARGDHEAYIRENVSDTARQLRQCLFNATSRYPAPNATT